MTVSMFEYRITKYNPAHRNAKGTYTGPNEWTEFFHVGQTFTDGVLTLDAYERVEAAYVDVAVAFAAEAGVTSMIATGVWNRPGTTVPLVEGAALDLQQISVVLRRQLRGEVGCRLACAAAFVHTGWDYYMYVGVARPCPIAAGLARSRGLYVEPFRSPYHVRPDEPSDVAVSP